MNQSPACETRSEALAAYVLGELEAAGVVEIEAHLAACPACRAWADALGREEHQLREVFDMIVQNTTSEAGTPMRGATGPETTARVSGPVNGPARTTRSAIRRVWWLPVAVAAGTLLAIGLWPGERGPTRAYAMSDVLAAVRNSALHVRGEMYIPLNEPAGTDVVRSACESWIDPVHGRSRRAFYWLENPPGKTNAAPGASMNVSLGERIIDGTYVMSVNHTKKWVEYTRLNDFHRALERRQSIDTLYNGLFGQPDRSGDFAQKGEKEINGVKYAVWELEVDEPLVGMAYRSRCAVNPRTGEIGEVLSWTKWRVQKDWQLRFSLTLFERGVAIPDSVFDTSPPPGYTLKNTKETAEVPRLAENGGLGNGLENNQYISFKLPDGSVLLAWGSRDVQSSESQQPLFTGLQFGGPLPKLPIEYTALRQQYGDKVVTYTGRHLAYTRNGDRFHEWSLYVAPEANAVPRWWNYHLIIHDFHLPPERVRPLLILNVSTAVPIDGAEDFETLVRGAMAELAADHQPPPGITYDRVMELAKKIRAELSNRGQQREAGE